jgi:hypothetical protein
MSQRFGARGDGFGMSRRPRTEIVISAAANQASGIRLERNRPTWNLESEEDIDPPPTRTREPKMPPRQ